MFAHHPRKRAPGSCPALQQLLGAVSKHIGEKSLSVDVCVFSVSQLV